MKPETRKPETRVGVIGYPVGHSLSPLIHNYWIGHYGFNAAYDAVEIMPERFHEGVRHLIGQGYAGFNVTIPHKQAVMELCDTLDKAAARIGAVNTVSVRENGSLHGMNTDAFGFVENILEAEGEIDVSGGKALVLGAGGAARAVIHGLSGLGVKEIILANRTREKAEAAAAGFPVSVVGWDACEQAAEGAALLVNTTSLGMTGQPPLAFDLAALPPEAAVCDIVYKPLMTALLRDAKARGNKIVTGIGMLLQQARPAFNEWFGVMPVIDAALRQKVLEKAQ